MTENVYDVENMSDEQAQATAYDQGWRPEEEYKGKGEWADAKTFLDRVNKSAPLRNKQYKQLETKYEEQSMKLAEILDRQTKLQEQAEERGRKAALAEITKKRTQAIEDGDVLEVARLDEEANSYNAPAQENAQAPVHSEAAEQAAFAAFRANNYELVQDQAVADEIIQQFAAARSLNPGIDAVTALEQAKEKAMKLHDVKPAVNTVMTGAGTLSNKKSGNSYNDIDAGTREFYDREWQRQATRFRIEKKMSEEDLKQKRKEYEQNCVAVELGGK